MISKTQRITGAFFIKALPNIGFLSFIFLCFFWGFPNHEIMTWLGDSFFFAGLTQAVRKNLGIGWFLVGIWDFILVTGIAGALTVGIAPIAYWGLLGIFLIRDAIVVAGTQGSTLMTALVIGTGLIFLWSYGAAAAYKLGEFKEDSSDYDPPHLEGHVCGDHITIREVGGYSDNGAWFTNILLYLWRLFVLTTVGIILFIIETVKILNDT